MTDYAALCRELRELMAKRDGAFAEWRSGANPRAEAQARYYTLELKDAAVEALPALLALAEGAAKGPVGWVHGPGGIHFRFSLPGYTTQPLGGRPLYALTKEPES